MWPFRLTPRMTKAATRSPIMSARKLTHRSLHEDVSELVVDFQVSKKILAINGLRFKLQMVSATNFYWLYFTNLLFRLF